MEAVIEQIEWLLERSDKDIKLSRLDVEEAENRLAHAQQMLDQATKTYNHVTNFKGEALLALEVLRAHDA